jgi:hypothetical protein
MIELFHHRINLPVGYVLKTAAFGKVSPDQPVGVLVLAAFPGTLGMRKIHIGIELLLDGFMPCKRFAVVGSNRQSLV